MLNENSTNRRLS